jgi:hypothetical protein
MAWTDNANNEDGFKILRQSGANQFFDIATLPANTTFYLDNNNGTGLAPGTEYDYHIQEFNIAGYSDFHRLRGRDEDVRTGWTERDSILRQDRPELERAGEFAR